MCVVSYLVLVRKPGIKNRTRREPLGRRYAGSSINQAPASSSFLTWHSYDSHSPDPAGCRFMVQHWFRGSSAHEVCSTETEGAGAVYQVLQQQHCCTWFVVVPYHLYSSTLLDTQPRHPTPGTVCVRESLALFTAQMMNKKIKISNNHESHHQQSREDDEIQLPKTAAEADTCEYVLLAVAGIFCSELSDSKDIPRAERASAVPGCSDRPGTKQTCRHRRATRVGPLRTKS